MSRKPLTGPPTPPEETTYEQDVELITNSLLELKKYFILSPVSKDVEDNVLDRLGSFQTLTSAHSIRLWQALRLGDTPLESYLVLLVVNGAQRVIRSRHQIKEIVFTEFELVGLVQLDQDLGQVLIRPETIGDKVAEIIGKPLEVDFDFDRKFSRKYHVFASDEARLRAYVTPEFTHAIARHNGLEIEVQRQRMLLRLRKRITVRTSVVIAAVTKAMGQKAV